MYSWTATCSRTFAPSPPLWKSTAMLESPAQTKSVIFQDMAQCGFIPMALPTSFCCHVSRINTVSCLTVPMITISLFTNLMASNAGSMNPVMVYTTMTLTPAHSPPSWLILSMTTNLSSLLKSSPRSLSHLQTSVHHWPPEYQGFPMYCWQQSAAQLPNLPHWHPECRIHLLKWSHAWADLTSLYDDLDGNKGKFQDFGASTLRRMKRLVHGQSVSWNNETNLLGNKWTHLWLYSQITADPFPFVINVSNAISYAA